MKGNGSWSYSPYRPPLESDEGIYITRVVPSSSSIRFEWLENFEGCEVFYRKRGEGDFIFSGTTSENHYEISGLDCGCDYEFYVRAGEMRSRTRLAVTGESVGVVVNYLHPDDEVYAFSGRYLCSPSLLKHPDGYLLASMDVYAPEHPQNLTLIFRSDDGGASWHYVSELYPCFWGKLFLHNGDIYMLACSTEYGDLLIGKSSDGAKTFSSPITLLRGSNGKNKNAGVHKNPQNIIYHGGRLWTSLEWGTWWNKEYGHAAMVMSCGENADLLSPLSWSFSEPVKFDFFSEELQGLQKPVMTIEGTLALAPDGELLNIMRFGKRGHVIAYRVDTENYEAPLKYKKLIKLETSFTKFTVKYDTVSGRYYTVVARLYEGSFDNARNLLSLLVSDDLDVWRCACDIIDRRECDAALFGMQYVDFDFDGEDIIFLSRTAQNGAHSFHDSNYQTFHVIKNFRKL